MGRKADSGRQVWCWAWLLGFLGEGCVSSTAGFYGHMDGCRSLRCRSEAGGGMSCERGQGATSSRASLVGSTGVCFVTNVWQYS